MNNFYERKIRLLQVIILLIFMHIAISSKTLVFGQSLPNNTLPCSSFNIGIVPVETDIDKKIVVKPDDTINYKINILAPCVPDGTNLLSQSEQITLGTETKDSLFTVDGSFIEIVPETNKKQTPLNTPKKPED